ncbi:hypothetical protein V8C37DRAFT_387279 [Trichoderma ceciliae]
MKGGNRRLQQQLHVNINTGTRYVTASRYQILRLFDKGVWQQARAEEAMPTFLSLLTNVEFCNTDQ